MKMNRDDVVNLDLERAVKYGEVVASAKITCYRAGERLAWELEADGRADDDEWLLTMLGVWLKGIEQPIPNRQIADSTSASGARPDDQKVTLDNGSGDLLPTSHIWS